MNWYLIRNLSFIIGLLLLQALCFYNGTHH